MNTKMKKLLLPLITCISLFAGRSQAQTTDTRMSYNNVILFDCTQSMLHKNGDMKEPIGEHYLWKPAKDYVKAIYKEMEQQDIYTIILFQGYKSEKIISGKRGDKTPEEFNDEFETLANKLIGKRSNTCISEPWDEAMAEYFHRDSKSLNFLYVLTDGHENCGISEHNVSSRIKQFCRLKREYDEGFYVALTTFAKDPEIIEALQGSCMELADISEEGFVNFASILNTDVYISTDDVKGTGVVPGIYSTRRRKFAAHVTYDADKFFEIELTNNYIENGQIPLKVSIKEGINVEDILVCNNNDEEYPSIPVKIVSDDPSMKILGDGIINIHIQLKPEKTLSLLNGELGCDAMFRHGENTYYKGLFSEDHMPEDSYVELNPQFKNCSNSTSLPCSIFFKGCQELNYSITYNGEEIVNSFVLSNSDENPSLQISIHKKYPIGELYSNVGNVLKLLLWTPTIRIDRFNFELYASVPESIDFFVNKDGAKSKCITRNIQVPVVVKHNPLLYWIVKLIEILLAYIIISLTVMRGRVLAKKKFVCGTIRIFNEEGKAILNELSQNKDFDLYGYTKCIITNKKPTKNQGYFDEHFIHGKIGHIYNRTIEIDQDIIIVPLRDDSIYILEEFVENGKVKELNINNIRIRITNR